MPRFLKITVAVAAIFALTAIGAFGVEAFLLARDARGMARNAQQIAASLTASAQSVQQIIGDERKAQTRQTDEFTKTIADVHDLIIHTDISLNGTTRRIGLIPSAVKMLADIDADLASFDATQKQAGASIAQTGAALAPVIAQSAQDLAELQPVIRQIAPLLQQSTAVAANLNAGTADVAHEIHKLVYPPPRKWYQKYFLDPLRTAAHLLTIPIRP